MKFVSSWLPGIAVGVMLGLLIVGLTGCSVSTTGVSSEQTTGSTAGKLESNTVPLPGGGSVVCVTDRYTGSSGGGVSCDWANAE